MDRNVDFEEMINEAKILPLPDKERWAKFLANDLFPDKRKEIFKELGVFTGENKTNQDSTLTNVVDVNFKSSRSVLSNSPERTFETLPYVDLTTVPLTEMSYLIEDFIPAGCVSMIYGDGGQGKSYFALYLSVLIAAGKSFAGKFVNKKDKVLYLDFELSAELQKQRLERICKGLSIESSSLTTNLLYLSPGTQDNVPSNLTELIPSIKKDSFDLIVIDSIGAALSGDPEAAKDICRLFQQLRQLGAVLLLDHQSKKQSGDRARDKTPFGSVYKTNLSRNVWHLNSVSSEENKLNCLLSHKKSNFSALREPMGLEFGFGGNAFTVDKCEINSEFSEFLSTKEQVLNLYKELSDATAKEIAEELGIELGKIKPRISDLTKQGKLEKTKEKRDGMTVYKSSFADSSIELNANFSPEPTETPTTINLKDTFPGSEEIPEELPF
jgi:archaellum biogenesis ATPase FlaH